MATMNKMSWVKDCLANQWEHCSVEELAQQIIQGETEDSERLEAARRMANDWVNDKDGFRLKYQMSITLDTEAELEDFISDYMNCKRG